MAESCTGSSGACPADVLQPSTAHCTGASQRGACDDDAADHYTRTSALVCVDVFKSSSTVCRGSTGQCDMAESCTGISGGCPADVFQPLTTHCTGTSQGGACDDDAADQIGRASGRYGEDYWAHGRCWYRICDYSVERA